MKFKFLFLLLTSILIICFDNFAFAQEGQATETGSGIFTCTFMGNTLIESASLNDNSLLLLNGSNPSKTKVSLISRLNTGCSSDCVNSTTTHINIIALFNDVTDIDSFLAGTPIVFMNKKDVDFSIRLDQGINSSQGILNHFSGNKTLKPSGIITITSHDSNTASGKLKLIFKKTIAVMIKGNKIEKVNKNNGRVVVDCEFINIPISEKEEGECNPSEEDCI